jgi:hypothetical protein
MVTFKQAGLVNETSAFKYKSSFTLVVQGSIPSPSTSTFIAVKKMNKSNFEVT